MIELDQKNVNISSTFSLLDDSIYLCIVFYYRLQVYQLLLFYLNLIKILYLLINIDKLFLYIILLTNLVVDTFSTGAVSQ